MRTDRCWHCGSPVRQPRGTDARNYAAKLLRVARQFRRWQVEHSLLISRRDNTELFEMGMSLEAIAQNVATDYGEQPTTAPAEN